MASVYIMTDPPTHIDYSIADNRVKSFDLRGEILFDENKGIDVEGWKTSLIEFVKEQGLHKDKGKGLHAFIYGLIYEGLIANSGE